MKNYLLLILLLLKLISTQAQILECERFKNGKFYYKHILLRNKIDLRKDSIQECYSKGKLQMVWAVKWINNCEYELICKKILDNNLPFKIGDRILATIIKTKDDCFTTSMTFYNDKYPNGKKISKTKMCFGKQIFSQRLEHFLFLSSYSRYASLSPWPRRLTGHMVRKRFT